MSGRTRTRNIMGRDMSPGNEAAFRGIARSLDERGKSPKTKAAYHQACLSLERHLTATGASPDLLEVTRELAGDWMIGLQAYGGWTPDPGDGQLVKRGQPLAQDSVVSYFGSARRFFNWAAEEELIDVSPMARMSCPPPSGRDIAIPDLQVLAGMLDSCRPKGRKPSFYDRRDEFMIRLFCETGGPRCSEVALLPVDRVDFRNDLVEIKGKGGKWRRIPLCARAAQAGARYARMRQAHPDAAALPYMFLGLKGQLSADGVYKIIARRSEMAGGHVHPHQLRHLAADLAKADEMTDGDLMELFGWSTPRMLHRYGRHRAGERAIAASRRHAIGNRL